MNSRNKKKVLVFVHDAGGAEVIGAYIKKNQKRQQFVTYGGGPAKNVFARLNLSLFLVRDTSKEIASVIGKHTDVAYAITAAPGWMSNTEINALKELKKARIKSIVYMDSWVDERKRFGYPQKNWKENLPDEFWAGDSYAEVNLRKQFPRVPVRFVANQYLRDEMQRFHTLQKARKQSDYILFTSTIGTASSALLNAILVILSKTGSAKYLRIRFHPADNINRYNKLIQKFSSSIKVEKSTQRDLVQDLAGASVVVGAETMALAVASVCKIRTVSFVPRGTKAMLPFRDIKKTHSLQEAASLI